MEEKLTLGITTIADLLLENKISKTQSGGSLEGIALTIPEYQRPYKWTAKNANQLLDDIQEAQNDNKEVYRVGTLILHHDEAHECYNIVDGQQRTITFSLMLKVFDDASHFNFLDQKLANNGFNLSNVANNYSTLKRRIDQIPEDKDRNKLAEYIKNNCELIVVITEDLSDAFQFFDSQNARGKSLYPHDLLKAYHLREMTEVSESETEHIVKTWEDLDHTELALLFGEYLYRLKEWIKGNRAYELTEHNIDLFKGITLRDNYPYAQFYKGAFAFADNVNESHLPFVTGIRRLSPFQLNTPIIAGKPFFEYAKHYFDILADIRNNDKYEGYFINDNEIVKTLDLRKYRNGVGNRITRLMFDTAILLYVDRFCPTRPEKKDTDLLEQFVVYAFIWAYSMRAQYVNVGWQVAENYIGGKKNDIINGFNLYKVIAESDSPNSLLGKLSDLIRPIIDVKKPEQPDELDEETNVFQNYLHFFKEFKFWSDTNDSENHTEA